MPYTAGVCLVPVRTAVDPRSNRGQLAGSRVLPVRHGLLGCAPVRTRVAGTAVRCRREHVVGTRISDRREAVLPTHLVDRLHLCLAPHHRRGRTRELGCDVDVEPVVEVLAAGEKLPRDRRLEPLSPTVEGLAELDQHRLGIECGRPGLAQQLAGMPNIRPFSSTLNRRVSMN